MSQSNKKSFAEALAAGVLVFDGAMGTELYRRHVFTNRSYDELCLSDPKLLRQIHADYRDAGADVLSTNTFGANAVDLAKFGLSEQAAAINRAGAQLARTEADAADRPVYVAGSIGPLPPQPQYAEAWDAMIALQAASLIEGGADFVIFETQPNRDAIERCAAAMRRLPQTPYIISFALCGHEESASGEPLVRMLAPLPEDVPPPVAWGMNCGLGPDGLLSAVEKAVQLTQLPLVVQPNAGLPKEVEHRKIYFCSPEYLAEYAKRFVALGAAAVGGCCGTTPEHVREIARAIKPLRHERVKRPVVAAAAAEAKPAAPPADKSRLGWKLARGVWITTVELVPPRGYDLSGIVAKSRMLHRHGVDAINIPDGPRASSRISPLVTAARIQQEAMIETILHFCCRDRNLIGMQADLLACAACEVRNILFVTGDPPKLGAYPDATGVFDSDSIGMAAVQKRLNAGLDLGGQAIDPQTFAVIGVGVDPSALDQAREIDRFQKKVEAGAEFAITQPVFDVDALLRFLDRVAGFGVPILAGMWPLVSLRNATFMKNEVPGVVVPDAILQRMAAFTAREDQLKEGIQIAREAISRIRPRVAGVQVSAPLGNVAHALSVIEDA